MGCFRHAASVKVNQASFLIEKKVRAPLPKSCSCKIAARIEAIRARRHSRERVGHQSPIEFQGGESLLNFGLIKSVVCEAERRAKGQKTA